MTHNIYDRLKPIFEEIMEIDDITLTPELNASDVDAWDSLNHIRLIVAVEEEFETKLSVGEVASLRNVGDLVSILEGRKVN
ncbi:MAG: acyl carrier protein [Pseudomonadales bacterium]|nr:acyl carrier protein [Pseudomonadales bacterium]